MNCHRHSVALVFIVLHLVLCNGQFGLENTSRWWLHITTTAPAAAMSNDIDPNLADYYDTPDNDDVCCECVPFYLCSENNTIIDDGSPGIAPRFGPTDNATRIPRVINVEMCPDVTELCCRPLTASETCSAIENRVTSDPNTPCSCVHWEFCLEEYRISDGSPSSTFIEGKRLPAHASCQHSLEVCCAFEPEPPTPPVSPDPTSISGQCLCVNPWLCGMDGFMITDGSGILDLRNIVIGVPPCVPPMLCCREPIDITQNTIIPNRPVDTPSIPMIDSQQCNGIRNTQGISVRISGFREGESQFGEFPWVGMVLRTYFVAGLPMNAFIGGAIILHPRVLLTAAHKVVNEAVESLTVRVGEWDIETDYEPGDHQVRSVDRILVHPAFNNRSLYHDVALMVLTEPIVLQPHIRSICLASFLEEVDTTACVINGWGKDSLEQSNYQTVMKSITLPLVPHRRCQAMLRRTRLGRWFRLHPSFQCAGGQEGLDACTSDGGGPLACPRLGSTTGEYLLVGVTAWGIGCGEDGVPGVYASTVADHRWISSELDNLFPGHSAIKRNAGDSNDTSVEEENKQQPSPAAVTTTTTTATTTTTMPTTTTTSTSPRRSPSDRETLTEMRERLRLELEERNRQRRVRRERNKLKRERNQRRRRERIEREEKERKRRESQQRIERARRRRVERMREEEDTRDSFNPADVFAEIHVGSLED